MFTLLLRLLEGVRAEDTVECEAGVLDCEFDDTVTCAENIGEYPSADSQGAIMVISTVFALFMAYGIGSNDAANSWATSVGSGAISLKKAVLLCGFFEWLGATCLGMGVSSTIQKGVSDVHDPNCWACGYCNSETSVYMAGMMGALIGASIFLQLASLTSLPVSTTHAIVGGVVGMTMAGAGADCLNWEIDGGLGGIVLSWVISPVFSGAISVLGFALSRRFIINGGNARDRALLLMPILFFVSSFILLLVTTLKAKAIKNELSLHTKLIVSALFGVSVGLVAFFVVRPRVKKTFPSKQKEVNGDGDTDMELQKTVTGDEETAGNDGETAENDDNPKPSEEDPSPEILVLTKNNSWVTPEQKDAIWVFRNLLVYNACLESFAHGSNDTANATGAFTAVYQMYTHGQDCKKSDSDWWILSVAGIFVALGVITLGYRVISTIGSKLTKIDYHKGFWIEFGSTVATIVATLEGFPVSTTHCQVGAVFCIGLYCKLTNTGTVNARLLLLIFGGWIITLPLAGGIAALVVVASRAALRQ